MRFAVTFPAAALLALGLAACDSTTLPFIGKKDEAVKTAKADPIDQAFAEPAAAKAVAPQPAAGAAAAASQTGLDRAIARVRQGDYLCAGKVVVNVSAAADNPREFVVRGTKINHRMVPVETASGAVRLEDQPNGIVWLQVRERAMLMNQTKGQRVAAECVHQ